jgi:peptidoglycan/xylan/chitin deacetylase (PgdA/CDA1 family)
MMKHDSSTREEKAVTRRWRLVPIIPISMLVHAASVVVIVLEPVWWSWALGTIAVNQLALFLAVLTPRSTLLGPNLTRLPQTAISRGEVCITFDDGPDPRVTPRVLDLLDRHDAKASFFCVGENAAAFPQLVREIVRRGHSVENHSNSHSYVFAVYGRSRLLGDIGLAQRTLTSSAAGHQLFFVRQSDFAVFGSI